MAEKKGLRLIVCRDVHDSPRPPRPDAQRASCALCHRGVWVSKATLDAYPDGQLVCNRCGYDLADIVPPGLMEVASSPTLAAEGKDGPAIFNERRRDPRWRVAPYYRGMRLAEIDPLGRIHLDRQRPVCDFCCAPEPRWKYPCGYVELPEGGLLDASDDEWAACDLCHELIEAGEVEKLIYRCVKVQAEQFGTRNLGAIPADDKLGLMRETLRRFTTARKGPAVPYSA